MTTEPIPHSQRRYVQTALIVAQQLEIAHWKRPWWKRTKDVSDRLAQIVGFWYKIRDRLDAEYGAPDIPMHPFKDEMGNARPPEWYDGISYYTNIVRAQAETPPSSYRLGFKVVLDHPTGSRFQMHSEAS